MYEGEPFVVRELHFLRPGREKAFSVDLRPVLKEAGFDQGESRVTADAAWSTDGRFVLLYLQEGVTSATDSGRGVFAVVDPEARTVRALPPEKATSSQRLFFYFADPAIRWRGSRVLLPPGDGTGLRLLEATDLSVTAITDADDALYYARWLGDDVVVVTPGEVALVRPGAGRVVVTTSPTGETFVNAVQASPTGERLAVPREKRGEDGLVWVTIDVLDLTQLQGVR